MAMGNNLHTVRGLLSEVRRALPSGPIRESAAVRYLMAQFRKYQTTEEQVCKASQEAHFSGETYLCYLRSSRKYNEIKQHFHGQGERSVQETANMVGFKLPHDPNSPH